MGGSVSRLSALKASKRFSLGLVLGLALGQLAFFPVVSFAGDRDKDFEVSAPAPDEDLSLGSDADGDNIPLALERQIVASTEADAPPAPLDNFGQAGQVRRLYEARQNADGSWADVQIQEIPLGMPGVRVPDIDIPNFARQVRTVVDHVHSEVRFEFLVWDRPHKRYRVSDAHVLTGVQFSSPQADVVLENHDYTFVSDQKGVEAIYRPMLRMLAFKAPVPRFNIVPDPREISGNASIRGMKFLTPEVPRLPTSETIFAGSSLLLDCGEGRTPVVDYRKGVVLPVATHLLHYFVQLQAVAPDPELTNFFVSTMHNLESLTESVDVAQQDLLLSGSTSPELQQHFLRSASRHVDLKKIAGLLRKDPKSGKNAFEEFAGADWFEFTGAEWETMHATIARRNQLVEEVAEQYHVDTSELMQPWEDVLVQAGNSSDEEIRKSLETVAQGQQNVVEKKTRGIFSMVPKLAIPSRVVALAGSVLAFDTLNYVTHGKVSQWTLSTITYLFGWTFRVPGLSALSKEVSQHPEHFHSTFGLTLTMTAIFAMLSFRPLAYMAAKKVADLRGEREENGEPWDKVKAFFSYGIRLYARGVYPIRKVILEQILQQKNVYYALENRAPLNAPGVWNSPARVAEARERLDRWMDQRPVRNARAQLLAVAMVSESLVKEGQGIDPVTLTMLMTASDSNSLPVLLEMLDDEEFAETAYEDLSVKTYRALAKLSDEGIGKVDESTVAEYITALQPVVEAYKKHVQRRETLGGRATNWIQSKWISFRAMASSKLLPFLSGLTQYQLFRRYKHAEIDSRNRKNAQHQFDMDFDSGTFISGFADPFNYARMLMLHMLSLARIVADTMEQIFVYGVQVGPDNVEYKVAKEGFFHPAPPLIHKILDRSIPSAKNGPGAGRLQSVFGATWVTARDFVLNESDGSPFRSHLVRMKNTVTGLKTRFIAGVVPRAIGLTAVALVAGRGLGIVPHEVQDAVLKQMNVLFTKLSAAPYGGKFIIGYATIWAAVIYAVNVSSDAAAKNRASLKQADAWIDEGLRLDRGAKRDAGIEALQTLYRRSGKSLPKEFNRPAAEFTDEQTLELCAYSKRDPAVSTIESVRFNKGANIFGAVVSTILALTLSKLMYNPDAHIVVSLMETVYLFPATYLLVNGADFSHKWVTRGLRNLPRGFRKAKNAISTKCAQVMHSTGSTP